MSGSKNVKRSLFVMRHAERVDFTFGDWIPWAFDENGVYTRKDLNMPKEFVERSGGHKNYFKDGPLTNIGFYQAKITGEALKDSAITFDHVFSSPSLRCIQTCSAVLQECGLHHLKINVEPGLFEWLSWYHSGMPHWMTLEELVGCGHNLDLAYNPVVRLDELTKTNESVGDYYMRSYIVTKEILKTYKGGNILFVGHAATLDTCTRQLIGGCPREYDAFQSILMRTPYASIVTVVENHDEKWDVRPAPIPSGSVTQASNQTYNWEMLRL